MPHPQRDLLLGMIATLLSLGLLVAAGRAEPKRSQEHAAAMHGWQIEIGAELYADHCRNCHGINGEGVGQLGPALHDDHFFTGRLREIGWQGTLREYVASTIALGRVVATVPFYAGDGNVVMPAWSQAYGGPLRSDEVRALTAFVLNWEASATGQIELHPVPTPTPSLEELAGQAARGEKVFLSAGCSDCHTIAGLSSGVGGPDLTAVAGVAGERRPGMSAADYLRESVLIPNAYLVPGYAQDVRCGGVLSQRQLDELVAFLLTRKESAHERDES